MANGVLVKTWEVHCANCERPQLGLAWGGSVPDAAEELRRYGWHTRRGLWVCESCSEKLPPGSMPAAA